MNFVKFFEQIAWAAMTAVALYAATQLRDVSDGVARLNTNVAVVVERIAAQERDQLDMKNRIDGLERHVFRRGR